MQTAAADFTITRYQSKDATHTVLGPDALTPHFVVAARRIAETAPAPEHDGEAWVCGDQRLLSQRPGDTAIAAGVRRRWVQQRLIEQGYVGCAGTHVEEALWSRSVRGRRQR